MKPQLVIAFVFALAAACGETDNTQDEGPLDAEYGLETQGKGDAAGIQEATPEAAAILAFTNQPLQNDVESDAFFTLLDAKMNVRAVRGIVAYRGGQDGAFGTDDDQTFETLVDLDRVKYVGPIALSQLHALAVAHGYDNVCPGATCDCAVLPTPTGCLASDWLTVSRSQIETSEAPTSDAFEVRLKNEPKQPVMIWISSTNPDEASVFPMKLLFCPVGYTEIRGRCDTVDYVSQFAPVEEVHWNRSTSVEVSGVMDQAQDEDQAFSITFTVETGSVFEELSATLPGTNAHVAFDSGASGLGELADDALLAALHNQMAGHRVLFYSGQNSARMAMFTVIDSDQGQVEGIYTGRTISNPRGSSDAYQMGFNTEHSWPQSQFDHQEPMRSDLHHIFPSDVATNGSRSSYEFGMVAGQEDNTGSLLGTPVGGGEQVFQVRPERRGDIARAHFYLVARYQSDTSFDGVFDDDVLSPNGSINDDEEVVLRQWHLDDPVDALEKRRNNRIQGYQGNRNPFVDTPELVGQIANF